ncbi:uncharacterized protein F5891DRAFT_1188703 [Suillus fuscotomentosus]|uniref:Uncharacterized protein n=1 Tax=Suillus fuscotomentosus TaxID=1912939 RepID=A0AAD4HM13_9AGAM|nr:uncharacterized protein F5891DRAFT_1188703 [Suillus fuscotomentosus]KAG1900389.1 hypothetical protein F5891DRAFT_1188703 [Suillus fuscotomentosus]
MYSIVASLDSMDVDHDKHEGEGTHLEPMDIDHDEHEGEDVANNTQPENYMIIDDDEAGGEDVMEVCDSVTENSAQPRCALTQFVLRTESRANWDDLTATITTVISRAESPRSAPTDKQELCTFTEVNDDSGFTGRRGLKSF